MNETTVRSTAEELEQVPPDVETMRATVRRLLAPDAGPTAVEVGTLTLQLRGHLAVMIPEVEAATLGLPKDDIPKYCARACVGEARMRLRLGDGSTDAVRLSVAVKLARSVRALCDHWENLGGGQLIKLAGSG